jgi:hypothetical protein
MKYCFSSADQNGAPILTVALMLRRESLDSVFCCVRVAVSRGFTRLIFTVSMR